MKSLKQLRDVASALEFEHDDALAQHRRHLRERAKRVAVWRAAAGQSKEGPSEGCPVFGAALITLTRHAEHRMQNRAIKREQVLLLTGYGCMVRRVTRWTVRRGNCWRPRCRRSTCAN